MDIDAIGHFETPSFGPLDVLAMRHSVLPPGRGKYPGAPERRPFVGQSPYPTLAAGSAAAESCGILRSRLARFVAAREVPELLSDSRSAYATAARAMMRFIAPSSQSSVPNVPLHRLASRELTNESATSDVECRIS